MTAMIAEAETPAFAEEAGGGRRAYFRDALIQLARKPVFLHDSSVPGLDALLDPKRGANAPHPFYLDTAGQRGDVIEFLKGLTVAGVGDAAKQDPPAAK